MPAETRVTFDLCRHSNWLHACHHNFQSFVSRKCLLFRKIMVLLETPDKQSLIFALIPPSHRSSLNIPWSSHVPTIRNPEVRSRFRAGRLNEPPCPTHCPPKVWFRCCLKIRRKWGGVPSYGNHLCCRWWIGWSSKGTGKWSNRTRRYTAPVSLLGEG
jgi:hypothetical protein